MKTYLGPKDAENLINIYGFSIFPVHGITPDDACTCGNSNCINKGKHPATNSGLKNATNNVEDLKALWNKRKHLNVGIATGEVSGIFVVDIDSEEGLKALEALCDIPDTLTVSTGKGRHLYFKYPGESVLTKKDILPGVDVRGDGGYVVGPLSNHRSGGVYEFVNPLEVIRDAPEDILNLVLKSRARKEPMHTPTLTPTRVRNHLLNQGWTQDDVKDHLAHINPSIGYDEWINVGMALHQEGHDFSLWDDWSSKGTNYQGTRDTHTHWKSFNKGGGVTYGTVVAMAKSGGWRPKRQSPALPAIAPPSVTEEIDPETGEVTEVKKGMYLINAEDVQYSIDENDFVQGLLEKGSMSVVYGESNCGKTFFMTDLAYHVSEGKRWRDKRVEQGAVIYVPLEGTRGLYGRVQAYKNENKTNIEGFKIMPCGFDFLDAEGDVTEFTRLLDGVKSVKGGVKLIVIDTLARAIGGGDENSGQDMGLLVKHADYIRSVTGAHICFIHHSGKDKARGARGHSSLRAAVDTEIEISRQPEADYSTVKIVKQREMEMGEPMHFKLKKVVLGINKYEEEKSSCVVLPYKPEEDLQNRPIKKSLKIVYEALVECIGEKGRLMGGNGFPNCKVVHNDDLKEYVRRRGILSEKESSARVQYSNYRRDLIDAGLVVYRDNYLWITQNK